MTPVITNESESKYNAIAGSKPATDIHVHSGTA